MNRHNHEQEAKRLATLLRSIAEDIEKDPSKITWYEEYHFEHYDVGELNIDLDYRGCIADLDGANGGELE